MGRGRRRHGPDKFLRVLICRLSPTGLAGVGGRGEEKEDVHEVACYRGNRGGGATAGAGGRVCVSRAGRAGVCGGGGMVYCCHDIGLRHLDCRVYYWPNPTTRNTGLRNAAP